MACRRNQCESSPCSSWKLRPRQSHNQTQFQRWLLGSMTWQWWKCHLHVLVCSVLAEDVISFWHKFWGEYLVDLVSCNKMGIRVGMVYHVHQFCFLWFLEWFLRADSSRSVATLIWCSVRNRCKSEWVIKFNGLSGDSGQRCPYSPYSPYKPCNHSLYIGIIIFLT